MNPTRKTKYARKILHQKSVIVSYNGGLKRISSNRKVIAKI
jgi:hypothetical protein